MSQLKKFKSTEEVQQCKKNSLSLLYSHWKFCSRLFSSPLLVFEFTKAQTFDKPACLYLSNVTFTFKTILVVTFCFLLLLVLWHFASMPTVSSLLGRLLLTHWTTEITNSSHYSEEHWHNYFIGHHAKQCAQSSVSIRSAFFQARCLKELNLSRAFHRAGQWTVHILGMFFKNL